MRHRQTALFGYKLLKYPGDLILPEFSVSSTGSESIQASGTAIKINT